MLVVVTQYLLHIARNSIDNKYHCAGIEVRSVRIDVLQLYGITIISTLHVPLLAWLIHSIVRSKFFLVPAMVVLIRVWE